MMMTMTTKKTFKVGKIFDEKLYVQRENLIKIPYACKSIKKILYRSEIYQRRNCIEFEELSLRIIFLQGHIQLYIGYNNASAGHRDTKKNVSFIF